MKINHLCGSIVIQAHGAFLNGSGSQKEGKEEISMPKRFQINGVEYPYISAQCWRRWWKQQFEVLYEELIKSNSVEKKLDKSPFLRAVDDLFGYFESADQKLTIEEVNKVNVSQIRSSPVQITQLHPIQEFGLGKNASIQKDKAFVHLQDGTPLPYSSKFYNADLQAILAIDLQRIGLFRNFNDRQELAESTIKKYLKESILIKREDNVYELASNNKIQPERVLKLLESLLIINGGAKSTQYGTDITPKIFIIAGQKGANPILSNIFEMGKEKIRINLDELNNRISIGKHLFQTPIFIGIRSGYLENYDELKEKIPDLEKESNQKIILTSPYDVYNRLKEEITK
jgi:CRISPR-associated protein Cst2